MATPQSEIIERIKPYLNSGLPIARIADETGVPYHTLYRIMTGKRKDGPRADAGRSRSGVYETLVPRVLDVYLQQGKVNNLQYAVNVVYDQARCEFANISRASLRRHVDAAAKAGKWAILWKSRKDKPGLQQLLPKNNYDRTEWPFMGFLVMDNRTSDNRVYSERQGRLIKPYQYFIFEACTGSMVAFDMRETAFTRLDVARLIVKAMLAVGRPVLGFICDNGSEQVGGENIMLMECFWEVEYVQACRERGAVPELHTRFDGAISPIITSLARIPTFPGKAALERAFATLGRYLDAPTGGHTYGGTGRGDQVATSLVRTPRRDRTTLTFDEYAAYCQWFFTADGNDRTYGIPYKGVPHPESLRTFARETGLEPTIGNAWDYHWEQYQPQFPPRENLLRMFMHTEVHMRKRVTRIGQVRFMLDREWYTFSHPGIHYTLYGELVDVVLDPYDNTRALLLYRGEVLGIADDLDRRRRSPQHGMTMAESRYWQRENRNAALASVRDASKALPAQRKIDVPEVEVLDSSASPFALGGTSHAELMDELTNQPDGTNIGPGTEIDADVMDLFDRYQRRSTL